MAEQTFHRSLSLIPKFQADRPWRIYRLEILTWAHLHGYSDAAADVQERLKGAILFSLKGTALERATPYGPGSEAWTRAGTMLDYLNELEQVFQPAAESMLSKEEFTSRIQGRDENVITYISSKFAIFDVAFPVPPARVEVDANGVRTSFQQHRDETVLVQLTIKGLYNTSVKRAVLASSPTNRSELRKAVVQAVANERIAYADGYSTSTNLDGLASATTTYAEQQKNHVRPREEAMDIDLMKDAACFRCLKPGHLKKDCRVKLRGDPRPQPRDQQRDNRPKQWNQARGQRPMPGPRDQQKPSTGGKPKQCFNCGDGSHFIRDCPKPRKIQTLSGQEVEAEADFLGMTQGNAAILPW